MALAIIIVREPEEGLAAAAVAVVADYQLVDMKMVQLALVTKDMAAVAVVTREIFLVQ